MSEPALKLSSVNSGYGESRVVQNVSLAIQPSEIMTLLGKNGMGKTTLLKTIMGFIPIKSGEIILFGEPIHGLTPHTIARRAISYTPQEQAIFQELTVRENLRLGLRDDKLLERGIERVTESFEFLRSRMKQRAGTLSGGEQKMLLLCRALISNPKLMLIDEITEGLQPSVIERLAQALRAQRDEMGTSILLIEQHVKFALAVADRFAVLKMGEITSSGSIQQENLQAFITDQLSV